MKERLLDLLNNSYSPYSKFKVAAIIEMSDGNLIEGVNVENASYGATICAERSAIVSAISKGYKKGDFKRLHVMTDSKKISSCCFLCRQIIVEFFKPTDEVILYDKLGNTLILKVEELCTYPFSEDDLK